MSFGNIGSPDLDEVLSRAIDRQLAEQRALRQALDGLTEAINSLIERAPPVAEVDTGAITDRVQRAIEAGSARLADDLREFRDSIEPQLDPSPALARQVKAVQEDVNVVRDDVKSVQDDIGAVGEAVTAVTADVEGIAQALIDLNAGLRTWADDVDASVEGLREAVDAIRDMPRPRPAASSESKAAARPEDDSRLDEMERQVRETAELSLYITDQIEDLDGVLNRVGELPAKIEGAVAQAMRRTLTLREKLDQESSDAIAEVVSSLKAGLDSINATLNNRLDEMEAERRDAIQALADAIDRSAEGKSPRAAERLARAGRSKPKPRKPAPKRRRAKPALEEAP